MIAIGKKVLGLLLVLAVAMPLACASTKKGSSEGRPEKDVTVGGEKGVVVKRSDSGTEVKVGGDKGVVVEHSRD